MDKEILAAAARFERDQRLESYGRRLSGASSADQDAFAIDYQCWVAIVEWLETDRFFSFAGGAEPERADAPIIRWPELEHAAETALVSVAAKVERQEAKAFGDVDELAELYVRRARLMMIHRKVALRRQSIDNINAELRSPLQAEIAA